MTNKDFNKADFEREMKKEYSKMDIMTKGKRVGFETPIKDYTLSKLIYGDKTREPRNKQEFYMEVWDNFKSYN